MASGIFRTSFSSGSQTVTITEVPEEEIEQPHFQPSTEEMKAEETQSDPIPMSFSDYLDLLTDILSKYSSWQDPISKLLSGWGWEIITIDPEKKEFKDLSPEEFEMAKNQINDLKKVILFNPMDKQGTMFNELVLEREWPWEKWMLDDYNALFQQPRSPFDGQMHEKAKPHEFAQAIISWLKLLPDVDQMQLFANPSSSSSSSSSSMTPSTSSDPLLPFSLLLNAQSPMASAFLSFRIQSFQLLASAASIRA